jgi:organic radical activating enzyme
MRGNSASSFGSRVVRSVVPGAIPSIAFTAGHLTIDEILSKVRDYGCQLVEVTGGEPLAQPAALPLIARLCDAGYTVLIETSGAIDVQPVDRGRGSSWT